MDSSLEGQYTSEDATGLVVVALKCLEFEARDQPDVKFLLTAVEPLQKQKEVSSHTLMGLIKTAGLVLPKRLSPLGKACARMDLTAVHEILLETGYRDQVHPNDAAIREWTPEVGVMYKMRSKGDIKFRLKDFKNAIDYYSKVTSMMPDLYGKVYDPSATTFVRRALSYLMVGEPELALWDAIRSQVGMEDWPTAFYMQAFALSKLGRESEAQDMLDHGASLETWKKQKNRESSFWF